MSIVPTLATTGLTADWLETRALPAIQAAKDWEQLDDYEDALRPLLSALEQYDQDTRQVEAALLVLATRRGEFLLPRHQGKQLPPGVEEAEVSDGNRARWRTLAEHKDAVMTLIRESFDSNGHRPPRPSQSEALRRINGHEPAERCSSRCPKCGEGFSHRRKS